ncbi:hypothetical protein DL769_010791 [Monosporascus sp. CRB-8-3]|nr:hypothetical protein DL769_010791 [Monosporascus sp. CRB-8-3]
MVVRTPTLNSLKRGFLPQIHQPLPLSRRESQQLLDSITSSFRKNLDKEHPWQSEDAAAAIPAAKSEESSPKSTTTTTRHRPTDRHLRAILSNPLFSHPTQDPKLTVPTPTRNPFDVFDAAVAKGLMTPRRAAGFLATVRAQVANEQSSDARANLAATGAGLRVLQWLRASGQENDLRFLSDPALVQQLVPFMYAEGLEEVAWTWLSQLTVQRLRVMKVESGLGKLNAQPLFKLLNAMIQETSHPTAAQAKSNLDASYSALLRAYKILPKDYRIANLSVKHNWASLSWASTVDAFERPKPSVALFEAFVQQGRPYSLPLDMAHLELHHPTAPSSDAAVYYMHSRDGKARDITDSRMGDRSRRRLICLALDTVDRLKQTGNTTEASWVERFLTNMCENLNLGILNLNAADSIASERPLYRLN